MRKFSAYVPDLASLRLEHNEDAGAVRFDGAYCLLLLGHGQPSHFGGTLRLTPLRDFRSCEISRPADNGPRPCAPQSVLGPLANNHTAGAFPSMTLFLAAIVVLAAGLLGTLFLLFRDAHRGTKDSNVLLAIGWK